MAETGTIRAGMGGWVFAPWRDNFYPAGWVQRRELEYASRQVGAIEINSTYYRAQNPSTYARWRDETPVGFVFSAKAPKRIMQSRRLAGTRGQVEDFLGDLITLDNRLGPVVWQIDRGQRLDREDFTAFLDLLPARLDGHRLRHALDVRDATFVDADHVARARARGMAIVFTDAPELPQAADLTADFVYARLMRSRSGLADGYAREEIAYWAGIARDWSQGKDPVELPHASPVPATPAARDVFVFFIAAAKERNPAAALALQRQLGICHGGA